MGFTPTGKAALHQVKASVWVLFMKILRRIVIRGMDGEVDVKLGKVAFEDFGRERGLERALGTGGRNQAFLKTELDDFGRDGGTFSGDLLNAGARDFAFVHQGANDAYEFFTVSLQMSDF